MTVHLSRPASGTPTPAPPGLTADQLATELAKLAPTATPGSTVAAAVASCDTAATLLDRPLTDPAEALSEAWRDFLAGCAVCGLPEIGHGTRHHPRTGQHQHQPPTGLLIEARARAAAHGLTAPDQVTGDGDPVWTVRHQPSDDPDAQLAVEARTSAFEGPLATIAASDGQRITLTPGTLRALLPRLTAALADLDRRDADLTT